MVSTYPPTACGLATFTSNLRTAVTGPGSHWLADVLRLLEPDEPGAADDAVAGTWRSGDADSLRRALSVLSGYDVVLVQHEFRLFGGRDGSDVLDLVEGIERPLIVGMHTVPRQPNPRKREIIDRLLDAASAVIVQAGTARERLITAYGADPARVAIIEHGAAPNFTGPPLPGVPRPAVLTWGLLRPGKGLENGIAALARLRGREPEPTYVIAGRTHPKFLAVEGERYRERLRELAAEHGVADLVRFDDGYHDTAALQALVRSADVVLLPYESREQVSSGVLVEALAAGKPVVATRFPHAVDLLSDGAGLLVEHDDDDAMAVAIGRVLYEPGLAAQLSAAARRAAAPLLWPAIGARYRDLLDGIVAGSAAA